MLIMEISEKNIPFLCSSLRKSRFFFEMCVV